ncbi:hypothetical protein AC578_8990 [Pseudocercospora eumusae]|uniref:Uncharacterized protein n=1 Tax=Pseudocercospora eumusae TaxID=321146 RepID=A0A139HA98_9PEZI|nr:hypothetical protein AC578_8990 [Pseudocercospora eumusae]
MPSRLSKLFSSDKEEALAERDNIPRGKDSSSSSEQLPSYEQDQIDRDNILQPPDITAGFSNLSVRPSDNGVPVKEETVAHLKVLEAFYRLRQSVGSQSGLFGIHNNVVTGHGLPESDKIAELLARLAEKRWAIYVQRAVDRFEAWWNAIIPNAYWPDRVRLESEGKQGLLVQPANIGGIPYRLVMDNLPPLDVLMVWHAFMLNPRAYFEDCLRQGHMGLWHCPFPWEEVAGAINSETFAFEPSIELQQHFTELTKLPWDNLEGSKLRTVRCPYCQAGNDVPWTTCNWAAANSGIADETILDTAIDQVLSSGYGFSDKDFLATCSSCNAPIHHDRLRAGKFARDLRKLIVGNQPMAGTVLGMEGIPFSAFGKRDMTAEAVMKFPNELLRHDLGTVIESSRKAGIFESEGADGHSVDGIRGMIEGMMKNKAYMRKVRGSHSHTPQRAERVAIRKMMSRYWDNSSPFALDLVGAVIRQGTFIEKMHNIDWLHSPALPSTMERLITKYQYFMKIMKDHPTRMAVPTLDVDLVWHTHQLNPAAYMGYTITKARQFIDHDDKVAEVQLNDAFAWTSKTYQKLTGQPYSECTCWYCEAIRESHTSAASRFFQTSSATAADELHAAPQDPKKSVHISTHNAVRPTDTKYDAISRSHADDLEKAYQKACERAKKKGKPVPKRDDYYYSDAYGYPVYIPAYSPYIGFVPYAPMYYPATPGCMAVGAGAVGNCCSGTCGGGVAAGGCTGAGGGGCAAGAAGGCGSGGGGGCGGGGGGGGCGGGGGGC